MNKLFYTEELVNSFNPPDVMFEQTKLVDDWLTMDKEIERLEGVIADMNKWISVKDKLPKNYHTVLTYDGDGCVILCYVGNGQFIKRFEDYIPTHWMPLPEPPKDY
jgi:hypothetical protein